MADTTVSPARHDEPRMIPVGREVDVVANAPSKMPRSLIVLWLAFAVALGAFLFIGSVRIGAGNWIGRRMGVSRVWDRFLRYLSDQGASQATVALVVVAAVIALLGGLGLVWLAFSLRDGNSQAGTDDSVDR